MNQLCRWFLNKPIGNLYEPTVRPMATLPSDQFLSREINEISFTASREAVTLINRPTISYFVLGTD